MLCIPDDAVVIVPDTTVVDTFASPVGTGLGVVTVAYLEVSGANGGKVTVVLTALVPPGNVDADLLADNTVNLFMRSSCFLSFTFSLSSCRLLSLCFFFSVSLV